MKFYKYLIDCFISWFLIISLYDLYIKLMQRKKIVVYRSLCLCSKKKCFKTTIFFRCISFIYKLYKLIIRNHDIIQSILNIIQSIIKSHIVKLYEIILIDIKLHKFM